MQNRKQTQAPGQIGPPSAAGFPRFVRGSCRLQHRHPWVGTYGWFRIGGGWGARRCDHSKQKEASRKQQTTPTSQEAYSTGSCATCLELPELSGRAFKRASIPTEWVEAELEKDLFGRLL